VKVLITGAAGYLGSALVRSLGEDHDLTLADISVPETPEPDAHWVRCDVTELSDVSAVVPGHDAVVHTVALVRDRDHEPIERFIDVMVKGTWNVAQACAEAKVPRLVNISSIVAGGWPPSHERVVTVDEALPFGPVDLYYGLAKRLGEEIVNAYDREFPELATLNLRPGVIAGIGAQPEPSRDDARGPQWFMYVDPRDVANLIRRSITLTPAPRGTYNLIAGRSDALFDWQSTADDIGYISEHTWPSL
jgi:nucleoside-diphosphate-sugar epimerase